MANFIIGIDEVGRGSLAGPVVVAAVLLPRKSLIANRKSPGKLRDSKKLSPKQREEWSKYLRGHPSLCYSTVSVGPREIERLNISRAANLAALRAFKRLVAICDLRFAFCRVYLDGGLYLGNHYKTSMTYTTYNARTVVRADEKIPAVAAASIIAKVHRDRLMVRMAKKYPAYGFEKHKGYGTAAHRKAIIANGASTIHRLTFLRNYVTIQQ